MQDIQHWSTDTFFGRTACNLRAWCSNSLSSFKIDEGLGFPRQRKKAASCLRGANSILTSDISFLSIDTLYSWEAVELVHSHRVSKSYHSSLFCLYFSPFIPDILVWCESSHRLKHGVVLPVVGSRHQAWSTNQPGTHIAHHVSIQVGHDHHIELLGPGNKLPHNTKT